MSAAAKTDLLIELTISLEEGEQAAHECKNMKYSELADDSREGDLTIIYPVLEGFIGASSARQHTVTSGSRCNWGEAPKSNRRPLQGGIGSGCDEGIQ